MLVEVKTMTSQCGRQKRVLLLSCDSCANTFERAYARLVVQRQFHFCTRRCVSESQKSGGKLREFIDDGWQQKYEKGGPLASASARIKAAETKLKRYGDRSFNNRVKAAATCIGRYGVDNPAKASTVRHKIEATCNERYGVTTPLASSICRDKGIATSNENWGVDHYMKSAAGQKLYVDGMLRRYDVMNPSHVKSFREKARQTCIKRYGVAEPFAMLQNRLACASRAARARAHETMKANGTYARSSSSMEDRFYELLTSIFDKDDVKRHVEVNGWCIDFYVVPFNLYIQFDGVYWHGLDRPIDVIREFKNPRDVTIYNTYLRDRAQEQWFDDAGMQLLRITDQDNAEEMMLELIRKVGDKDGEE